MSVGNSTKRGLRKWVKSKMERLTVKEWRNLDPWECCGQDDFCTRGCHDEGGCRKGCIVPKLYVRLAKYEDAEEQGQLYISPLKIGDTVFLTPDYPAYWDEIEEAQVTGVALFPPSSNWQISTSACLCYGSDDIGKKGIFLTREEAEQSLNSKK